MRCCHQKRKIGILAYGSLNNEPGKISPHIAMRIKTKTPFPVEYARLSQSRGDSPTLVPREKGGKVEAEILVLADDMTFDQARDLLWRRERHREESTEPYSEGTGPNRVLVRKWNKESEWGECPWVETVLYTDFNPSGKKTLSAEELAQAAIASVRNTNDGKDGVSYLQNNIAKGIKTPLTRDYEAEILKQTKTHSLQEALRKVKAS
jgi:hypothetical protein